ncbi:MAG TPA: hypothetical protein VJP06_06845 [Thermoplasmata archaeon]|nr:hypothetical protein [Thermoplasmata archaeon]
MLKEQHCVNCGKRGCEHCLITFGHSQDAGQNTIPQRVCSQDCFDRWVGGMIVHGFGPTPWGQSWMIHGTIIEPAFAARAHQLAEQHRSNLQVRHAANLIEAERFEDAARIYDGMGMWKEAGEARRRAKRTVVTQVQVDVNSLIDQVRKGGLTTTYSCPACHSPIQINAATDVGALKHCQYCGSVIQSTDLVEFLSRVVGYR